LLPRQAAPQEATVRALGDVDSLPQTARFSASYPTPSCRHGSSRVSGLSKVGGDAGQTMATALARYTSSLSDLSLQLARG